MASSVFRKSAVPVLVIACLSGIACPIFDPGGGSRGDDPPPVAALRQAKILEDWPTPQAVFVFSGQQHGYLEPCGCSPEFQKGGVARRFGFINSLQQKKWPVIMADLGGLLEDPAQQPAPGKYLAGPEQAKVKLETALDALHQMKYEALNLAPEDLAVRDGFLGLMGLIGNLKNPPLPRALNANFGVEPFFVQEGLIFPHITRVVGGVRIAIIGMVGEKHKDQVADQDLNKWQAPGEVLGKTLSQIKRTSDLQVLMLYGTLDEAKQLADVFSDLDAIIYASDTEEPSSDPVWVKNTMLVTIGVKGKNAAAIGIFKEKPRLRFELVALDDRFDEDEGIRELLDQAYIEKLAAKNLVASSPKVACDKDNPALGFVGSKKCGECHQEVYKFWQTTRHSHALETLVNGFVHKNGKKIAPGKQVNPECVSCHTTGFFNTSGYDGTDATSHLGGNGCENCHGPGSEHVNVMSGVSADQETFDRAKKRMQMPPQDEKRNVCVRCHDVENSPKFQLDPFWDKVEHGGPHLDDREKLKKIREKLIQPG